MNIKSNTKIFISIQLIKFLLEKIVSRILERNLQLGRQRKIALISSELHIKAEFLLFILIEIVFYDTSNDCRESLSLQAMNHWPSEGHMQFHLTFTWRYGELKLCDKNSHPSNAFPSQAVMYPSVLSSHAPLACNLP